MRNLSMTLAAVLIAQMPEALNGPVVISNRHQGNEPDLNRASFWTHGRAMANHSKYSPQAEDRKHNFVNRRAR